MDEKRKSKRLAVDMELKISDLFKQNKIHIRDIDAPIRVVNVSRNGIGFESKAVLPEGYYFNCKLVLGSSESALYTVVRIIRAENREDCTFYGCEFIGMAPVLGYIFDEFENEEQ